ncbi:MAG: alpha-E domain-containing protein [Nitriliruptoraceae bacterium]
MLARLAAHQFWARPYVERAEDTARMVDVTYHSLLESPFVAAGPTWGQLLDVLHLRAAWEERAVGEGGGAGGADVDAGAVVRFLVLDRANPGSIAAATARARENVRSVRELVSSELWEAVNDLHLELAGRDLEREVAERPGEVLRLVRDEAMAIYGIASETMPRDAGWRFLALGRLIERAEMTCRLIDVRYGQLDVLRGARGPDVPAADGGFHHWVAVLKSASAFEAYRRRYRASTAPADVIEFLLLADDLPRSVLYALNASMRQLEALTDGRPSRALRLLGRTTSALAYRDVAELLDEDLHEFLEDVQARIQQVAEAVADEFFRHQPPGAMHAVAGG